MNFDKMKVVDLRSELQARGLDTKGKCLAHSSYESNNSTFFLQ